MNKTEKINLSISNLKSQISLLEKSKLSNRRIREEVLSLKAQVNKLYVSLSKIGTERALIRVSITNEVTGASGNIYFTDISTEEALEIATKLPEIEGFKVNMLAQEISLGKILYINNK